MGLFGALRKSSDVKIFKRLLLIQFQLNFMENILLGGGGVTGCYLFWRSAKFKNCMAL